MSAPLNQSLMTNRRSAIPFIITARFQCDIHAQPLLPAAVAYLCVGRPFKRYAST